MKKLVFIVAGVLLFLSLFLIYSKMRSNINALAKVQGQIYINNNFGFSLTFPESWNGNYYYFTDTDYPVGALTDSLQDQLMDINEKSLMKKDYIKAKAVEKEINSVLSTFKPIEISQ
jgi:hypothetical protein